MKPIFKFPCTKFRLIFIRKLTTILFLTHISHIFFHFPYHYCLFPSPTFSLSPSKLNYNFSHTLITFPLSKSSGDESSSLFSASPCHMKTSPICGPVFLDGVVGTPCGHFCMPDSSSNVTIFSRGF